MHSKFLVAFMLAFACGGVAHAVPIHYEGILTSGVPVTGSIGGFGWGDEVAAQVDFWRFSGVAGDRISIGATRGDLNLDPAFSLYFGTTTADEALFLNDADWGGMVFLTFADDEIANPGPGGDPALTLFRLPFSGSYTVAIGGFLSNAAGPYPYSLSLVAAPIPEPATLLLMATGLCAVAGLARRRSVKVAPVAALQGDNT